MVFSVHGSGAGIEGAGRGSGFSPWSGVVKATNMLLNRGVDLLGCCKRKVGDGTSVKFWYDRWLGSGTLKEKYGRVFALDRNKQCMVADRVPAAGSLGWCRRQPRGGLEEVQCRALLEELDRVSLSQTKDG